jgi:hypothetical protein
MEKRIAINLAKVLRSIYVLGVLIWKIHDKSYFERSYNNRKYLIIKIFLI